MGVVFVSSLSIANRDASPRVKNAPSLERGGLREAMGAVAITNGDSVGSIYRVAEVPSNARLSELLISAPDIGTTTAASIGLYDTVANGGAAVAVACFTVGFVLNAGAVAKSEALLAAGVFTLANMELPIFTILGLARDPGKMYDIALTLTGAADAGGTVLGNCRYISM